MSDEEKKAIDKLKTLIQYLNVWKENFTIVPEDVKYLVTILNLIEKQQKEMEELKEERKKYPIAMNDEQYKKVIELAQKDIKEELDRQINVRMINEEYIEKNYISKDKIKAKIEELEKDFKEYENGQEWEIQDEIRGQIDILQSLLEKE